jgi:hypothetical protein
MKAESQIQHEIFKWYHNNYCLNTHDPQNIIFSVPNESSNAREQIYKKSLGLISGVSDLIIVNQKEVLFVEVKTEIGKLSINQIKFQKKIDDLGHRYIVVRSLEDFKNKICKAQSK